MVAAQIRSISRHRPYHHHNNQQQHYQHHQHQHLNHNHYQHNNNNTHHHYHYINHDHSNNHFIRKNMKILPIISWFLLIILLINSIDCRRQQQLQSQLQNKRNSLNTERFSDDSVDYYDGSNTRNNNVNDENLSEEIDEEFDDFVCPEKFGYYPDVKNCSKYHQCDHGKSRLKSCDDGLVFSTILKTCDWPYNVNCNQANGDRGDYLGKHLRLRNGELLDDNLDPSNTNRRQPVLMDEADDSYWLGRPNTDLLAFLNDDNLNNDYNNGPEEFNDFDIPRRPVVVKPQTTSSSPRSNNNVDDDNNNNKNNRRQHSTNANNKNDDNEPWFQNFNYNQRRPATLSANQRGNNQRHHSSAPNQHHRHHTTTTTTTTTTSPPTILPRKALRVGDNFNNDDYLYTDDGELHHQPNHNDLGYDYRRKSNKNDRDSYRIVSFNHHQHQQQNPTTFAPTTTTPTPTITTTRSQPVWFQQTTPTPIPSIETTINSAARIGSRPRHLGTSFRRKVLRKKIVSQTAATTPRPTTPAQVFGNFYNNDNNNNKNNNDPWKSFRYETVNRQPVTPIPPTVGPKHLSTIRRGIPAVQDPKQRPRFERKPVLRDESEDANERINDDDYEINNNNNEDDIAVRNLIYNNKQQEIVRKNSTISPLSHHNDDNLLLLPKNTVKDVSNNIGVRFRTVNQKPSIINQPITPKTITTTAISTTTHRNRNNNNNNRNKELNNVFDAGFRHAISPPTSTINHSSLRHQPPPPPSSDIEYEDIENEDEDEDFDIDDNNTNDNDDNNNNDRSLLLNNQSLNNNNNKEIVVRYDDDTDDNDNNNNNNNQFQHHPSVTSRRQQFNQHAPPNRFAINNSTNNRFVNNVNADPYNHFPRSSPSLNSSAISFVDIADIDNNNDQLNNPLHLSNQFLSSLPLTTTSSKQKHRNNQLLHLNNNNNRKQQKPIITNPLPFVTIVGPLKNSNKTNNIINNNFNNNRSSLFNNNNNNNNVWPPLSFNNNNNNHDNDYVYDSNSNDDFIDTITLDKFLKMNKRVKHKSQPKPLTPPIILTNTNQSKLIKLKNKKSSKKAPKNLRSFNRKLLNSSDHYRAKRCLPERCQPPDCRCGGLDIPGGFKPRDIPQMVLLTFDDSVNDLNIQIYRRLFEEGRTNPNGCPIAATFYVSHEWTDYSQVQNLYAKGHEIASHSVSHSFGEKFSKDRWLDEILGQKELLHLYGGVDYDEIRGMRAPFLQTGGDTMFEMLYQANFSYDSSLPVYDIEPPYWPYTLDYAINHDCMIEPCPSKSYKGFWEVGMVMWEDLRGGRCSMADGCFNPPDEDGVYEMVKKNFLRHYTTNRAPFGMFFHSRWFLTEHNMNGFIRFLDEMLQLDDIYLVTNWQMIQWMRNPTPLSYIKQFKTFGCDYIKNRPPLCKSPHTCKARFRGEVRTLKTCQQCPSTYPWTGNNGIGA